jgi:hypothetical protein
MERLLLARPVRIDFADIMAVERHPVRQGEMLPGGRAPRMRLQTESRSYDFVFTGGLDDWIASLKERRHLWEIRQRFD